jgi:hypothetical protein
LATHLLLPESSIFAPTFYFPAHISITSRQHVDECIQGQNSCCPGVLTKCLRECWRKVDSVHAWAVLSGIPQYVLQDVVRYLCAIEYIQCQLYSDWHQYCGTVHRRPRYTSTSLWA